MKRFVLSSAIALVAGLFAAGLAIGAGQQGYGQSDQGAKTPGEVGVGTASGESQQVQREQQQTAHQKLNKEQVRELQKLLDEQGYNPGPQDGIMGSQTSQALRQYQKSQGIVATGKPDEQTLRALAPSAKEQEFFGLSPKFGGEEKQQQMQPGQMPKEQGVGPASGETK